MGEIDSARELSRLMDCYQNLVFSICLKMTRDYFASEDLTQETFLSAYRHLQEFDRQNEKAWICRIVTNKCIDYQRQSARNILPTEDEFFQEFQSQQGLPEKESMKNDVFAELQKACEELKEPYKRVAIMHFVEERSAAEIAELTGGNLKTVQTHIYRARAMLRKIYRKGDEP